MLVQEEIAIYSKYESQIRDNIFIVLNARKGLSSKVYHDIILLSGFKKEQIAQLFNTSAKTITRYTQENKNLDIVSSEHALKIIALFRKGTEIFGELEAFRRWIQKIKTLDMDILPEYWSDHNNYPICQKIGDKWIQNFESCVLRVPSAIIKNEFNYLINHQHQDFTRLKIVDVEDFEFDLQIKEN